MAGTRCTSSAQLILLTATGYTDATQAPWLILTAAFLAQCVAELVSSIVRDWFVSGIRPRIQILVSLQVWALDAALTPVGIMAVATAHFTSLNWVPLTLLPLIALVAHSARDRAKRIEQMRIRLEALHRERERLQVAVKRIGDAFGSKLDLDALTNILTAAVLEALNGEAGRGRIISNSAMPSFSKEDSGELADLLDRAEGEAVRSGVLAEADDGASWAMAVPISPSSTVAVISVARSSAPFTDAERELVDYLCLQAAVAAGDIARHKVLHRQALTDELTGLANHRSFQELLDQAFPDSKVTGAGMSLILLDLDDFKTINDRFGHQMGDRVLTAVGQCLLRHCRSEDEAARYGGEELAMLLPNTDLDQATQLAERLRQEVEELQFQGISDEPLSVTASFGVVSAGTGAPDKSALIEAADSALYKAKKAGKNQVCVAPAWSPSQMRQGAHTGARDLPSQLRRGIERDELVLFYQPKISLTSGAPIGAEALLRWQHPELGLLGPDRFLPWAEGTDLMPMITRWVLESSLSQSVAWRRSGLRLPVAVNISAQDLADPTFPIEPQRILDGVGARPEDLTLEITEHMAIVAEHNAGGVLADLRHAGISVSIDDFGTGHSSLTRLRDIPVDELKLDRDFSTARLGRRTSPSCELRSASDTTCSSPLWRKASRTPLDSSSSNRLAATTPRDSLSVRPFSPVNSMPGRRIRCLIPALCVVSASSLPRSLPATPRPGGWGSSSRSEHMSGLRLNP